MLSVFFFNTTLSSCMVMSDGLCKMWLFIARINTVCLFLGEIYRTLFFLFFFLVFPVALYRAETWTMREYGDEKLMHVRCRDRGN